MITIARKSIAAAALVSVSLAACGGGDDDVASDETTSTEAADGSTSTTEGSGVPGLDPLDTFVISWNSQDTIGKNTIEGWISSPLSGDAITRQPSDGGGEIFAARVNDGAVVGGRIEGGEVTSVFVGVDPDNQATASVIQTAFLNHLDDDEQLMTIAPKYRDVALSAETRSDYVTAGEDAFVLSLIEGAEAGDRLVAVSLSDLTDEAAARARAEADQTEVLDLLATTE